MGKDLGPDTGVPRPPRVNRQSENIPYAGGKNIFTESVQAPPNVTESLWHTNQSLSPYKLIKVLNDQLECGRSDDLQQWSTYMYWTSIDNSAAFFPNTTYIVAEILMITLVMAF